jgi:protein O-GlcNAc transferase
MSRRDGIRDALEQALALHRAGRIGESKAAYKRVLRNDPDNDAALNGLGMLYGDSGDAEQAEKMFRRAIAISPDTAAYHANLGVTLKRAGRVSEAIECYRRALLAQGDDPGVLCNLGNALLESGRPEEAVRYLEKAVAIRPDHADAHVNLAIALHALGRIEEACAHAREAVRLAPSDAGAHSNLGLVLRARGDLDEAERALEKAIALDPRHAVAHNNRGLVHLARGDADKARSCFESAVAMQPSYADAWANLGGALGTLGKARDALRCFERAAAHAPGDLRMATGVGNALRGAGRIDEAIATLQGVVARFPKAAVARGSLGLALLERRRYDEARLELERAIDYAPDDALAQNNLGTCHWAAGDVEKAVRCFRRALVLDPGNVRARSNLVMNLNYLPEVSRSGLYAEHRSAGERIEAGLKPGWTPHANSRDAERKLKIGYVSGDFCEHAVSFFTEPVLARHDKARFEVFCLSAGTREDQVTGRFREHADHWIALAGMSDERGALLVREAGIDILIDLSGHTALNRLALFARKPAPVQAHWLGYINTTGMESIDYRITDGRVDPAGPGDRYYTERLVRLPLVCAFEAPRSCPEVGPLPSLTGGAFTFACLNRIAKVTAAVVETWSRILRQVPESMLQLGAADDEPSKSRIVEGFERYGIPASRLRFMSKLPLDAYLALHGEIDLTLDPFPYNGGATSCHSLWMGVPFVALRGDRYMGRMGMDLLESVGLGEFVAGDPDEYVEIAVRTATHRAELAEIRRTLRQQVLGSPLGGIDDFARTLEAAYRGMWRAWCADPTPGFSHRAPGIDFVREVQFTKFPRA